jgi:purine-binding chemotaxis protein CheW
MSTTRSVLDQGQFLTFLLGDEEYAVGILRVKEIIEYDTLTKLPSVPAHVRGVINLRGSVVPVVDLAVRFGLSERAVTKRTCIIIMEVQIGAEQLDMGVIADSVSQVIDLPPGQIEPPPPFGTRVRLDYLVGMGKVGAKFVLILDVDRLLAEDEVAELAAAAAGGDAPPAQPQTESERVQPTVPGSAPGTPQLEPPPAESSAGPASAGGEPPR